ncbi:MAG: hypothetical protein IIU10_02400, partial [Paludibacteraceae bacterium]|nr:hypothetical protein [Paludibacteraceae bacterium]
FYANGSAVQLKETGGGFRVTKIYINEVPAQGFENAATAVKAEKFFRNGQLIIRKNGVEYNAIGTAL